jgi:hypothetical protein
MSACQAMVTTRPRRARGTQKKAALEKRSAAAPA